MLKAEHPCREILSSYQHQTKPVITWAEAKKHLHDVRLRRQNQLAQNINECHKLHNIHKETFNRQVDSNATEKLSDKKPIKPINNEYSLPTNKYSIPRIEYAPVIYRQAIPTFEVKKLSELENAMPIVKELTEYLTESPSTISNNKKENHQSLSPIRKDQPRRLSVSSISSIDKKANKVYEKWPDYNRISEIVGYRIDPPPSKLSISDSMSRRPSDKITQRKRIKSTGFDITPKERKSITSLNPSPTRRQSLKPKKLTTKTDISPPMIDKPSPIIEKVTFEETKLKLPNILCPSSIMYSNRIQTRQWLIKNHFSSNSIRTLPLL